MITIDEIELLLTDELRAAIAANLNNDPMRVALDKRLPHAKLVASQVKYLQRAKNKLPSYYAAQCVVPSLAFEQSSSEECAGHKSDRGALCIDLTCGLGVDSLYLSRRFDRVIAIEQNPTLAHLARVNFRLLGAQNIEVVCGSAEDFIHNNSGLRADMIYADPDRRGAHGEKLFRLEDCSPNVVGLLAELRAIAAKVMVKCSPLMDVDQALRLFGEGSEVEVISLGGECKEVVVSTGSHGNPQRITATAIGQGSFVVNADRQVAANPLALTIDEYRYLVVPDVALRKARLTRDFYAPQGVFVTSDIGYGLAIEPPVRSLGRVVEIERTERYSPKVLKSQLRRMGVKRATIMKLDFAYSTAKILKDLCVSEGGECRMAFTSLGGELLVLFLR